MILHLVSDRRRLAPGGDERQGVACLLEQARHAASAGVDVIQLREPDLESAALRDLAAQILAQVAGSTTRLVINDRLDVALAVGAHGVHLRATSFPAARVRQVAPAGFLIGRSVHSVDEAAGCGPVDYLLAGSVWRTPAKPPGHPVIDLAGLSQIVAAATVPVIAIGGLRPSRAGAAKGAGAAGIAAIEAWMGPDGTAGCRAVPLHDTARAFRDGSTAGNMSGSFPR
jgi:thiamine-phosphate pyrophosphorylase